MTFQVLTRLRSISRSCRAFGFTLLELLLVLVLIAISAATIIPRLGTGTLGRQLEEVAKNVRAMIGLARDLAATNQSVTALMIDTNSNCLEIADIGSDFNSQSKNAQMMIRRQYIDDKIEIKVLEGSQQISDKKALIFRPDGRTQGGTIVLEENGEDTGAKWEILIECDGSTVLREILTK